MHNFCLDWKYFTQKLKRRDATIGRDAGMFENVLKKYIFFWQLQIELYVVNIRNYYLVHFVGRSFTKCRIHK